MQALNPYRPPAAPLQAGPASEQPLAPRWHRLLAYLLDSLLVIAAWGFTGWAVARWTGFDPSAPSGNAEVPSDLMQAILQPGAIPDQVLGFAVFLLLQGPLLFLRQQTLGKAVLGLRIVDISGRKAGFARIVLTRELPLWLLGVLPLGAVAGLLEQLLILRKDRRCLHDHVAGTKVVKLGRSNG